MEQIKNVLKIKGNNNHVSQGSGISSNANIEGNKNDVSQGDCSVTTSGKTNKWPKANIINAIITATIGVIGLLFTSIINKSAIDSWVSNLF